VSRPPCGSSLSIQPHGGVLYTLSLPAKGEVLELVVVGEVAKPSHPHVARNEHADCIVDLLRLKVVVQQKQDLQSSNTMVFVMHLAEHTRST
jgi:hypothetical protein